MSDSFVQSFTHLKDRPKSDRALPMLQRIASLVKPIMRRHGWTLPVLAEFFPESPNLLGLNVNQGYKICLRLRPAHAPDTFLDEEDVIQTMLHELTHNVHGPHDEKFYAFLSKLQDEYDELQRSGYAGEGFFSKGHRLGVNVSHDLPSHLAKQKALEAAEKRRQTARVLGRGGRLGGRADNTRGLSPRELAAQAAERRARDEKTCGSGDLAEREAAKAAEDSIENKVIDLTNDSGSEEEEVIIVEQKPGMARAVSRSNTPPSSTSIGNHDQPASVKTSGVSRVSSSGRPALLSGPEISHGWSCLMCTLLNQPQALQCNACLAERPPDRNAGWTCMTCGEPEMPHDFWSCRFCGAVKTTS